MVKPSINPAHLPRAKDLICDWSSKLGQRKHDMSEQQPQSNGYVRLVCRYCGRTESEIQADL